MGKFQKRITVFQNSLPESETTILSFSCSFVLRKWSNFQSLKVDKKVANIRKNEQSCHDVHDFLHDVTEKSFDVIL